MPKPVVPATPSLPTWRRWLPRVVMVSLLLLVTMALAARAGGAGGSSRSSGGGGGDGVDIGMIIWIVDILIRLVGLLINTIGPIPTLLIFAGLALLIVWQVKSRQRAGSRVYSIVQDLVDPDRASRQEGKRLDQIPGGRDFQKANPDFEQARFLQTVREAFTAIQAAWSKAELGEVRRWISDGVYQRFSLQFAMMARLGQTNTVDHLSILGIWIEGVETDGPYDIVHVGLRARARDRFFSQRLPALAEQGEGEFTEFWSFIRRRMDRGAKPAADLYHGNTCPACSGELPPDLGERSQCPWCQTLVNSGEYDWVLSEISQAEDFARDQSLSRHNKLESKVTRLRKEDPEFCFQLLEDKASNAFLQILGGTSLHEPGQYRRFCRDEAWQDLSGKGAGLWLGRSAPTSGSGMAATGNTGELVLWNRLFLNQVELVWIKPGNDEHHLAFMVELSGQRVAQGAGEVLRLLDPVTGRSSWVLMMSRKAQAERPKGSLYAHQCPSCGAPLSDSLETSCGYCNSLLNAGSHEWVVTGLQDAASWQAERSRERDAGSVQLSAQALGRLYEVKDMAMANLLVLMAADGVFADEERDMARDMAKKLGFAIGDLDALFHLAQAGQIALRMPADPLKARQIYELMEQAARADGEVQAEEQALLDHVRQRYLGGS